MSDQSGNDRTSEIDILRPSGGSTLESDAEQPTYYDAGSIAEGDEALENRASEGPSESEATAEGSSNSDSTISSSAGQPKQVTDEVPEDIGDGQGDNIVLRQIRDAAMQESDPTLKEKLWDEYRRIKSGKR